MEIRDILQENINAKNEGKTMFMEAHSTLCDPVFGKNEHRYALFSYVPNTIQKQKNKEFIQALFGKGHVDAAGRDSLLRLFCDTKTTFPGVGRIRGSFHDVDSATRRAEHLVATVDPTTSVMVCAMGVPFPLVESGFAEHTTLVDKEVDRVLQDNIALKRAERETAAKDMKMREKKLTEEAVNPHKTPLENYIELRVKYAQVQHTLNEMVKKRAEYEAIVCRAVHDIKAMEETTPELKEMYYDSYMDACQEVGVTPPDGFLALLKADL